MTIPYNLGIPNPPNNPSADVPLMKQNTNSINQIIGVDHVTFGASPPVNGYHTIIHEVSQGTWNPVTATFTPNIAAIAGVNQLFSSNYTPAYSGAPTDTQLFNLTGLGGTSQLTGNQGAQEGWAWMGGMLVQWGKISGASFTGVVTFGSRSSQTIPFPRNCFSVVTGFFSTTFGGGNTKAAGVVISTVTNTQFTWAVSATASPSAPFGFYWIAIGN